MLQFEEKAYTSPTIPIELEPKYIEEEKKPLIPLPQFLLTKTGETNWSFIGLIAAAVFFIFQKRR